MLSGRRISSQNCGKDYQFANGLALSLLEGCGVVAWAAENARGRLSTLEEYLEAHPLQHAKTDFINPIACCTPTQEA